MRPTIRAISRYRPRLLTIAVFLLIATALVLSNLTFIVREFRHEDPKYANLLEKAYGWPLLWRGLFFGGNILMGFRAGGWHYSPHNLIGNIVLWLLMLAVPATVCEWLLRRHRLRLRWSLRTMMVQVAIVAACCWWFAEARRRANVQDSLIAEINGMNGQVVLERRGPQWLELVGADRFRRYVIGVRVGGTFGSAVLDTNDEPFIQRLTELPHLRYLSIEVHSLTPRMVAALGGMPQLRSLNIDQQLLPYEAPLNRAMISHDCPARIGKMTHLEELSLSALVIDGESLRCLADNTKLKSLSLKFAITDEPDNDKPLLRQLPVLPRLEMLDLQGSDVSEDDLRCLQALPCLKALNVKVPLVTHDGVAELGRLDSLEELAIGVVWTDRMFLPIALESLVALKRLEKLHLYEVGSATGSLKALHLDQDDQLFVPTAQAEAVSRALQRLRDAHPDIIVDAQEPGLSIESTIIWDDEETAEYYGEIASQLPAPVSIGNIDGIIGWHW